MDPGGVFLKTHTYTHSGMQWAHAQKVSWQNYIQPKVTLLGKESGEDKGLSHSPSAYIA